MAEGSPRALQHLSVTRWLADNFYWCEGSTVPRWLLYELYMESCSPNSKCQVNSSSFGKLIRLVFPDLRTRRLGTRGNASYHHVGISIKSSSSFYARYCSLLSEKDYHRHCSPGKASSSACQPSTSAGTSGNACSSGSAAGYMSIKKKKRTNLHCSPSLICLRTEQDQYQYPWPGLSTFYLLEQQVGDCIMAFWRSLQPEKIAVMASPDVCQLFKSYDKQLFKEMENILLPDFLEEVPAQYMESIRLFSKNVELWLLTALKEFPLLLQTSKYKEVAVFIGRLTRKKDLSHVAKTMRKVLNSNSDVTVLRSDLQTVINKEFLDVAGNLCRKELRNLEHLQNNLELKCLNDLASLLAPSIDIQVLLSCMSSNLHTFVIQPSRNKEEFRKLASNFQLRWNFLLSAVSKTMTLNYAESFGSWYLFNLLLMDFAAHFLLSYIEEEGDESFWVAKQNESSVLSVYGPSDLRVCLAQQQPQTSAPQTALITLMQSQSNYGVGNVFPEF
ncbi:DNA-binding protein RFX8 [Apus apus]|uniref:DNA-binding protein RFX8 n=1 Tax=Apus apus TaxID=8895 RepID=UPI0021F886E0|nr:DNA-binding protein RFX8 [Apus apus]